MGSQPFFYLSENTSRRAFYLFVRQMCRRVFLCLNGRTQRKQPCNLRCRAVCMMSECGSVFVVPEEVVAFGTDPFFIFRFVVVAFLNFTFTAMSVVYPSGTSEDTGCYVCECRLAIRLDVCLFHFAFDFCCRTGQTCQTCQTGRTSQSCRTCPTCPTILISLLPSCHSRCTGPWAGSAAAWRRR